MLAVIMGQFYIDDSVHDKAGFIIGSCVYTNVDIDEKIVEIIKTNGFDPEIFEYKSSANYFNEPKKVQVRDDLKKLLRDTCKLGIVIIPRINREQLGFECIKAINQFINSNEGIKKPVNIYIDQGMFTSKDKAEKFILSMNFADCKFHLEQNSIDVKGIQLADLSAHISSIQLKDAMGLITKTVKAGDNSGYDPDEDIELGFEMWATIRHTFFSEPSKPYTDNQISNSTFKVEPYGLYISDLCKKDLAEVARGRFGQNYLGCIH